MQWSWLRSFAEYHVPMLYWLVGVVVAAVGVTLLLWSAVPGAAFALLAIPLLLLAGLAAALAESVQAFRCHHGDSGKIVVNIVGTAGLGLSALPLTGTLAFVTVWIADYSMILRHFPVYQRVVADVQRGAIEPSGAWRERDGVQFMTETRASPRIVFSLSDTGYSRSGIVHDPAGDVMTIDPADLTAKDPQHHIGGATLRNCHATLITTYYRCDLWDLDED